MKIKNFRVMILVLLSLKTAFGYEPPQRPKNPRHPSSPSRSSFLRKEVDHVRKGSFLFLPTSTQGKVPLLVFAHGQALSLKHYETLFEHLARKGMAVLYPQYDKGFFDTNWNRMGLDYAQITQHVLEKYPQLNPKRVVFSGHSKGGYVGLSALNKGFDPFAALFFSPAGVNENALREMRPQIPLTLIYPQDDSIIKEEIILDILKMAASDKKQLINVTLYPGLEAGHFFPLTKKSLFGGSDGFNAYHYYGVIPWLFGALEGSGFLYGEEALDSGDSQYPHERILYP